MKDEHIKGRLEVADGVRIGIVLPNIIGGGYDSHCVAITARSEDNRINQEANARRLVACWNACEGMTTDELERYAALMNT